MSVYGVTGGSLFGNRGAEAMVATAIGRIRERDPGAEFYLFSYMPAEDRLLNLDSAVTVVDAAPAGTVIQFAVSSLCWLLGLIRIRLPDSVLTENVRSLRRCRALFDVSGISFHDGRLAVAGYNLMALLPAFLLKVPVVRLSQAMGPFRRLTNRLPARWVTRKSVHTFARGRITAELMETLDVPQGKWSRAADVAFAYLPEYSLTEENEEKAETTRIRLRALGDRNLAAVVPSSLLLKREETGDHGYVAQLSHVVRHLVARGFAVVVMPNATREGHDTLRNNDLAVIVQLREALSANGEINGGSITYVDFDVNTDSIRSFLEMCTVVITSRFHAMVAALSLGVPTLVLGWSHKYLEVLEEFGCEDYTIDFEKASGDLLSKVDQLLDNEEDVRARILDAIPGVTDSSIGQFRIVDELSASGR